MTRVPTKPSQGPCPNPPCARVATPWTVVLPGEVVSRLSTQDGAPLLPHDPGFQAQMAKAHDIIGRYRNALQILAR